MNLPKTHHTKALGKSSMVRQRLKIKGQTRPSGMDRFRDLLAGGRAAPILHRSRPSAKLVLSSASLSRGRAGVCFSAAGCGHGRDVVLGRECSYFPSRALDQRFVKHEIQAISRSELHAWSNSDFFRSLPQILIAPLHGAPPGVSQDLLPCGSESPLRRPLGLRSLRNPRKSRALRLRSIPKIPDRGEACPHECPKVSPVPVASPLEWS